MFCSFALKKATVSEDTVFRYCQVWTLWVKICTELLVPTNFSSPGAAEAETGSRINIVHAGVPLNPESAKDNFVNLLAPKNGVGEYFFTFFIALLSTF